MSVVGSLIGGAIGAVGSIVGGNQAAKAQKQAARLQAQQFQQTKQLLSPYTTAGEGALDAYETSVGLNGLDQQREFFNNFQTDPGWEASLNYATRGLENMNAISGRGYGGNVIAGLGDYLQKNMLDAYKTRQSQLGGLVDTGRGAAQSLAGFGQQSAAAQGQMLANAGYYQGAGIANAGNAIMKGLGNAGQISAYGQGAGLSGAGGNFLGNLFG